MPIPRIIYQFKITLLYTDPVIWRRIQVPDTYTFADLHMAIQAAMGWENEHLHAFRIGKRGEINISDNNDDFFEDDFGDENTFNGEETEITRFMFSPGDQAIYEYDMGDSWLHEVLLEGIFLKEKGIKYPRCIAGERACPPEDCGGIPGFYGILEALTSPSDPESQEVLEWLGKKYDPEKFDPATVKFSRRRAR